MKTAQSGKAAIEVLKSSNAFDFILSDVRMPAGDGIFLLKNVREIFAKPPLFYFLTGFAANFEVQDLINLGANGVIEKPFQTDDLINSILTAVKNVKN